MSALATLIPIGKAVGELIASGFFAKDQEKAAVDVLVRSMKPTPDDAAPDYFKNRDRLLGDADELERGPSDTDPPPKAA